MERQTLLFIVALLPSAVALAQNLDEATPSSIAHRYSCSAASAHSLIGSKLTSDSRSQALALSGASSLQVVRLGGTRDLSFTGMRLTVAVDSQQRITEITCD